MRLRRQRSYYSLKQSTTKFNLFKYSSNYAYRGLPNKVLYGEAWPLGPTPFPFTAIFRNCARDNPER